MENSHRKPVSTIDIGALHRNLVSIFRELTNKENRNDTKKNNSNLGACLLAAGKVMQGLRESMPLESLEKARNKLQDINDITHYYYLADAYEKQAKVHYFSNMYEIALEGIDIGLRYSAFLPEARMGFVVYGLLNTKLHIYCKFAEEEKKREQGNRYQAACYEIVKDLEKFKDTVLPYCPHDTQLRVKDFMQTEAKKRNQLYPQLFPLQKSI